MGYCEYHIKSDIQQPTSFTQRLAKGDTYANWSREYHVMLHNGKTIAQTIWVGMAITIMNGSDKNQYGTAVFAIERERKFKKWNCMGKYYLRLSLEADLHSKQGSRDAMQ